MKKALRRVNITEIKNIDAEAVLDWTIKWEDVDEQKIFIFGRSLGGAVAIDLCTKRQDDIAGLILENTFCSLSKF